MLLSEGKKNLLQLALIVKNSADTIEETLKSFLPIIQGHGPLISYWTILDTGSTDGTQDIIQRTLAGVKGKLYEEPFVGFTHSRNRCLDLLGTRCKYTIMVDDSYILQNPEGLVRELKDKTVAIASIRIRCVDPEFGDACAEYPRKLISLSRLGIKYFGAIHEDLKYGSDYTIKDAFIIDKPLGTQIKRTLDRKLSDIALLDESQPRDCYYIAMSYIALKDTPKANEFLSKRVAFNDSDHEEKFVCYMYLGHFEKIRSQQTKYYLKAALEYPERKGEAYFFMFLTTENVHWLKLAKESPLGEHRMPVDMYTYNVLIPEVSAVANPVDFLVDN